MEKPRAPENRCKLTSRIDQPPFPFGHRAPGQSARDGQTHQHDAYAGPFVRAIAPAIARGNPDRGNHPKKDSDADAEQLQLQERCQPSRYGAV
jgi:hypothetical protein